MIYNLGNFLPVLINILLIPLYTRLLTPTDYGILSISDIVIRILAVLISMGMTSAIVRFYFDFKDNKSELKKYLGSIISLFLLVGIPLALVLSFWGKPLFGLFITNINNIFHPYLNLAIWIALLSVIPPMIISLYRAQARALPATVLSTLISLLNGGFIVYFVVIAQQGVLGSLKGSLIAAIVMLIVTVPLIIMNITPNLQKRFIVPSLKFALPLVPSALAAWFLTFIDRVILNNLVGLDKVGIYTIGYSAGMIMYLIILGFQRAWLPFFLNNADKFNASQIFAKITNLYLAVIFFIGLTGSLFSKELLSIIVAPNYIAANAIIAPIILAYIFHGLYLMVVTPLFHKKQTSKLFIYYSLAAIVNIVLNLWWIPLWGIVGAAWATTVGYFILFAITFWNSQKQYFIPYDYTKIIPTIILAISLYTIVMIYSPNSSIIKIGALALFVILLYAFRIIRHSEIKNISLN